MKTLEVEESQNSSFIKSQTKEERRGLTRLIAILCIFNILLKASYSVCAPFLPAEANIKGVDQSLVGAIFCSYSVSFAIVSPIVGKIMSRFGRRNSLILGSALVSISNFGFVALHF